MARYAFVVFTNPVDGCEDEYNDWYSNEHLDDVLSVEGFVAAQRFVVADQWAGRLPHRYLAIDEVETDDLDAAHAALTAADLPVRALAPGTVVAYFRPLTERRTAP